MQVRVRLFAVLRERAGADEIELELPEDAVVMAVNQDYAEPDAALQPGDELALIPPVSGGSVTQSYARMTDQPLELEPLIRRVRDPRAGAIVTFQGVTRDVPELQYEAYVSMAERKMAEIVAAAIERHGLCAAAAEHRVGTVPLSEPSVSVAASAAHRDAAFTGAREIIDEIKANLPIWKREEGEWIQGTPPATTPRA